MRGFTAWQSYLYVPEEPSLCDRPEKATSEAEIPQIIVYLQMVYRKIPLPVLDPLARRRMCTVEQRIQPRTDD
jgi:hypothetical protein